MFWKHLLGITLTIVMQIPYSSVYAQLTASDSSLFNSLFRYPLYTRHKGDFYIFDSCGSIKTMYEQLHQSFPFQNSDFYLASNEINLQDSLIPLEAINRSLNIAFDLDSGNSYRQYNPCFALKFQLNGKSAFTYTTKTPCTFAQTDSIKTAILVVPGSGENTTSSLYKNEGYQCLYCDVVKKLSQYADVYTHIKPLQDQRAIYWNNQKLEAEINNQNQPLYIVPYLSSIGTRYGTNMVIENIALIKFLQSNYDRVLVTGLSHGGYIAYFASIATQPDALYYAGGLGYEANEWKHEQQYFREIMDLFLPERMVDSMKRSSTLFYFSVSEVDNPAMIPESFYGLKNVHFDISKKEHSFPTCAVWDAWIDQTFLTPHVQIDSCTEHNSAHFIHYTCKGQPPFHFQLYANNMFLSEWTSDELSNKIPIAFNAEYQIKQCTDLRREGYAQSNVFSVVNKLPFNLSLSTNAEMRAPLKHLFVYNLEGKLMAQLPMDENRTMRLQAQAFVNSLPTSLYFYKVIANNKLVESGLLQAAYR